MHPFANQKNNVCPAYFELLLDGKKHKTDYNAFLKLSLFSYLLLHKSLRKWESNLQGSKTQLVYILMSVRVGWPRIMRKFRLSSSLRYLKVDRKSSFIAYDPERWETQQGNQPGFELHVPLSRKKKEIGNVGDVNCKVLDHMRLSFESQTLWHHDYQDAWVNHIKVADKNPINILTEMVSITAPRMLGKQPHVTI